MILQRREDMHNEMLACKELKRFFFFFKTPRPELYLICFTAVIYYEGGEPTEKTHSNFILKGVSINN